MQNGSVNNERSAAQSAALRGAALAFANGKPPIGPKPKPKPNIEVGVGNNDVHDGARAAATKVGGARQPPGMSGLSAASGEDLRLGYQNTGSSISGGSHTGGLGQHRLNRLSANGLLQPPGTPGDGPRSASFIAATLAASRSPSVSPNPTGQQVEAKKTFARSPSVRSGSSSDLVDATPAPPMKGLIGMFEGNSEEGKKLPLKRSDSSATASRISRREPSPISVRTKSPPLRDEPQRAPKPEIKSPKPTLTRPMTEYFPPKPSAPNPPPTNRKPPIPVSKPIPIPSTPKSPYQSKSLRSPEDDASSEDSFVSASSQHTEPTEYQPSLRAALAQQRRLTSPSASSLPSTTATIDSMANAIVASSLASTRAVSPSKSLSKNNNYPPVPPARKTGRNHIFHHPKDSSRTPSPAKQVGMKTTLRKVKSKDSIDEGEKRRGKKSLVKKHPHKHHEGDRKRWRDSVTERERKRYEAVWASNRGMWLGNEESDRVCSLVVKDVWSRSRLNADILEEVYALVDRTGCGSLEREEFVVGMWLVDQRLRGRKLPVRVGESVWRSVGNYGGIKVHGPKPKK